MSELCEHSAPVYTCLYCEISGLNAEIKKLTADLVTTKAELEGRDATIEALTEWMGKISDACGFEKDTADAEEMLNRVQALGRKE